MPATRDSVQTELAFNDAGANPSEAGAVTYNAGSFIMRDSLGDFNPRPGGPVAVDHAWRRHFLVMGG